MMCRRECSLRKDARLSHQWRTTKRESQSENYIINGEGRGGEEEVEESRLGVFVNSTVLFSFPGVC